MNTIFKEFDILPGVLGSCISVRDNGILFSNLPESFTEKMVNETSNNLGRMMQMAEVKGLDPQTMSIRYDKFEIIAMPLDNNATLLVLCEPGSNTSLIGTTAYMLRPELEKSIKEPIPQKEDIVRVATIAPSNDQEYINKETSTALDTIKKALYDTVGPIAEMVYDDCVEQWTKHNPPNVSRIFELIGCISTEIDNADLFDEFKKKISTLL